MALDNFKITRDSVSVASKTGNSANVIPVRAKQFNDFVDEVSSVKDTGTSNSSSISALQTSVTALQSATGINERLVREVEVSLTKAQILGMFATPVTVLESPGAGKAIEFLSAVIINDFATAAYTGGGDVTINFSGGAAVSNTVTAANSFGAAGDKVYAVTALDTAGGMNLLVNTPLVITNAVGAFTDPGTAAGVGRVQVRYRVVTTGL